MTWTIMIAVKAGVKCCSLKRWRLVKRGCKISAAAPEALSPHLLKWLAKALLS